MERHSLVSLTRCSALALAALLLAAAPRPAVAQASAYVPLDDVSYAYIDALSARGMLRSLSGLERPYTRLELKAAIDSARITAPAGVIESWLNRLEAATAKYDTGPDADSAASVVHARFSGDLFATAQTSGRRELMLADDANNIEPGATIRMVMAGGPLAVSIRGLIDNRLNVDPEFAGRKDRKVGGRIEDAYGGGQWKYGEIAVGRVARNWGPPTLTGLQLGNYAYSYDHLYAKLGTPAVHISAVVTRLEDYVTPSDTHVQRYLSVHRLALRHASWEIGAMESYLYTGVGRGFEPSLANPFNLYSISWRNEGSQADGNLGMGMDGMWRSRRFGNVAAEVFLDDLQIDKCDTICHEPSSYALTISSEGIPVHGEQRGFASYTRVSNLAYRTPNPAERYTSFGVGLGRGFSDYDEVRVGLDLAMLRAAPLRIYAAYRRQGEGDYRKPYPPVAEYGSTSAFLSGVVMKVTRLAVESSAHAGSFEGTADVGLNHSANADHVAGRSASSFEGRVKISWSPRLHADF
jgi:hypothetical protein